MSTAAEIRERLKKKPRKFESLEIDGDTYWLQSLSDLEASTAAAMALDRKTYVTDRGRHYRELIIRAWVDGPEGNRIFTDSEQKLVAELPAYITQPLIKKIDEMNSGSDVGKEPEPSTKTDV